jgi:hypothetical protein
MNAEVRLSTTLRSTDRFIIKIMGSTSDTVPTLYTFSGSGNSYKIRLLQALLGIDIKHEELDFLVSRP